MTTNSTPTTTAAGAAPSLSDSDKKKNAVICHGCQEEFPSRNAVFTHLKTTAGACLSAVARADFLARVVVPDERVILLYGYRLDASSSDGSILPS